MGLLGAALTIGTGIAGAAVAAKQRNAANAAVNQANTMNFYETLAADRQALNDRLNFEDRKRELDRMNREKNQQVEAKVGPTLGTESKVLPGSPLITTSPLGDQSEANIGKRKLLGK